MKFFAWFKTEENDLSAASLERREIGAQHVREIRGAIELPLFPLEKIQSYVRVVYAEPQVEVPETIAFANCLFSTASTVVVTVPNSYLNRYYYLHVAQKRDEVNDGVESAWMEWKLNEEKLLKDWLSQGSPTTWGFDKLKSSAINSTDFINANRQSINITAEMKGYGEIRSVNVSNAEKIELVEKLTDELSVDYPDGTKYNDGCIKKALSDEPIFVLRAQDGSSPAVVLAWIVENLETCPHDKLLEAFNHALKMQRYPMRKHAD